MTNKEKFINFIQKEIFDHEDIYMEGDAETWEAVKQYWNDFCSAKTAPKPELTENGSKILKYMQETCDKFNNIFKSKEIGDWRRFIYAISLGIWLNEKTYYGRFC